MTVSARVIELPDTEATEALGRSLAQRLRTGGLVTLAGDLGAGKTTLVRALLRALGHDGPVRSPTYAIVESYRIDDLDIYHLDLYRLVDADELEYIGLREWLIPSNLVLVEWPERGEGFLPIADLHIQLEHRGAGRVATITEPETH